jgi:hypothetical protein
MTCGYAIRLSISSCLTLRLPLEHSYCAKAGYQTLVFPRFRMRDEGMTLSTCRECGREVSSEAAWCPHCGLPNPTHQNMGSGPGSRAPVYEANSALKPRQVSTATSLLWFSLAIGIVAYMLDPEYSSAGSPEFGLVVLVSVLGVTAFLIHHISHGRNWARITFLVLFLLGALPGVGFVMVRLIHSPLAGFLGLSQFVLQTTALVLLFSGQGATWFRRA